MTWDLHVLPIRMIYRHWKPSEIKIHGTKAERESRVKDSKSYWGLRLTDLPDCAAPAGYGSTLGLKQFCVGSQPIHPQIWSIIFHDLALK